jgi:hypothetical protein
VNSAETGSPVVLPSCADCADFCASAVSVCSGFSHIADGQNSRKSAALGWLGD